MVALYNFHHVSQSPDLELVEVIENYATAMTWLEDRAQFPYRFGLM